MVEGAELVRVHIHSLLRGVHDPSCRLALVERTPELVEEARDSGWQISIGWILIEAAEGLAPVLLSNSQESLPCLHLREVTHGILGHVLLRIHALHDFLRGEDLECLVLDS